VIDQVTHSEAETVTVGKTLGATLHAGDVVLLTGPLGAGKTAFVRGLAEGLGCEGEGVSSPTFTIVQEYRGPITLQHVDLYRLDPHEVDDLALEDLIDEAVVAVEWPDRWHRAPMSATRVTILPLGDSDRRLMIEASESGARGE
jgi:tRNA threonylcarbamoyladenosine biosynthesis protein TsaE